MPPTINLCIWVKLWHPYTILKLNLCPKTFTDPFIVIFEASAFPRVFWALSLRSTIILLPLILVWHTQMIYLSSALLLILLQCSWQRQPEFRRVFPLRNVAAETKESQELLFSPVLFHVYDTFQFRFGSSTNDNGGPCSSCISISVCRPHEAISYVHIVQSRGIACATDSNSKKRTAKSLFNSIAGFGFDTVSY